MKTGESWWSPHLYRILGLEPGATPPTQEALCRMLHGDDAGALAQLFAALGTDEVASLDCRVRVPSGTSRRLEVACRRVSGDLLVGVVRDVSDARHVAGVVHDVNNLIAAATLNLARARRMASADAPLRHAIDDADSALLRAGTLARHLLGAARHDHQQSIIQVSDVVRGLESLMRCVLPRRIDLFVHAPPCASPVDIDPLQLERVLINLVLNARDAITGAGSLTVSVTELADPTAPAVRIEVADTGRGMDAIERDAILAGPFSTKPGGHGLGLAVVRSVLEQVGGTMSLDTAPGAGTRFTLTLPAWPRCG